MPYNPCGRVVDISRRAYSVDCRFFRDDDRVSRVNWLEADHRAEALPFESCILSKQQEPDDWLEGGIGEVAEAPRTTTLATAPRGSGRGHFCGDEQLFREGAPFDGELPPVEFWSNGLPRCCPPALAGRGGAAGSGRAVFALVPGVTPGTDCDDAGSISLNTTYNGSHPGGAVTQWWVVEPPVPNGTYRVVMSGTSGTLPVLLRWGSFCVLSAPMYGGTVADGCGSGLQAGFPTANLYVNFGNNVTPGEPPSDYTFRVEAGGC